MELRWIIICPQKALYKKITYKKVVKFNFMISSDSFYRILGTAYLLVFISYHLDNNLKFTGKLNWF